MLHKKCTGALFVIYETAPLQNILFAQILFLYQNPQITIALLVCLFCKALESLAMPAEWASENEPIKIKLTEVLFCD